MMDAHLKVCKCCPCPYQVGLLRRVSDVIVVLATSYQAGLLRKVSDVIVVLATS